MLKVNSLNKNKTKCKTGKFIYVKNFNYTVY